MDQITQNKEQLFLFNCQTQALIEKGDILDKIIGVLENSGKLSLAWKLLNSASDSFRKWCHLHHLDISKIESLEPNKIEKLLPGIFAADFFEHFGENSKFYIFIDTYEALWDGLRDKGGFHEKDQWIRENLIPNMKGVSWVICGRDELLWVPECDEDWKMYLEQHPVDELPEIYCQEFLEDCGIENKDIRNIIIKASEGVPYYLNLSVDTYEKIGKNRQPVSEDFEKTQKKIFNTFVKYLNDNEIRALKVLSVPNSWDRALFEILMKKFDSGYPAGAFSELIKFSFIKKDTDGKCSVHQLMRKSLKEFHDPTDRKNINKYLLDFYSKKLENIDIKAITPEHELALIEAFYHAKESLEAEKLYEWFISVSDPFNRAAFWQLITPLYEEMLQIIKTKLGNEHPDVATTLNNLAGLYYHMGAYDKALPLYQRALEIYKEVPESEHPDVANSLNNLAELYRRMGAYDKALPLYQRALGIRENILGSQHPDVANSLNNFAVLYESMGEYDKALPLYQRALGIRENVLGFQHPSVATTLDNLAVLYYRMGAYDKALPLYQRALEIYEKVLGSDHPDVATTLNNLAELYHHMGAYEKSLPLFQRALEIVEKTLGPEHPDVATILNNLAGLHESMGEYNKALPLYQRALDTREKVLGPQHPSVAATLNNLANTYHKIGKLNESLQLYERSLDIIEYKLGTTHPYFNITITNLIELYDSMLEEMMFYGYLMPQK
ncbi:MAG: tetratricopeptide repeat protein [Methanosarcina vacuolata]|nr:tetratricopeptide repeat protein [Methanosarcina vacuolata]